MSLLSIVLQNKPDTWDEYSYDNVRFARIPLEANSWEFRVVEEEFLQTCGRNYTVTEIDRVQHPFAYGRFKMRKEHLKMLYGSEPTEIRTFLRLLDGYKIQEVLEFNCDNRKYKDMFVPYTGVLCSGTTEYILVVRTFAEHEINKRDTHRYPEYLIKLHTSDWYNYF